MPLPVNTEEVEIILQPWLGSMLVDSSMLSKDIAQLLVNYTPGRQTLPEMYDQLLHGLFTGISRATQGSMYVILDGYQTRRLTVGDIQLLADELMGLVFDKLLPFSVNFARIQEYAMQHASLSALRVLYQRYREYLGDEEFAFLIHLIKSTYPPERTMAWLRD